MSGPRRLGEVVAAGTFAIALACASPATAATPADIAALHAAPCPPTYHTANDATYSAPEVVDARVNNRFDVGGHVVTLVPPVDWRQNPAGTKKFRNDLANNSWSRVLFQAHRDGDAGAIVQARDLMLDWVTRQPRGGSQTATQAWKPKKVGDRGSYLAYMTRAADCAGVLSDAQAGILLDSLSEHANWIVANGRPNNAGLFDSFGLAVIAELVGFLDGTATWRQVAESRFETGLRGRIVDEEGFWLEQSSIYHWRVTQLLREFTTLTGISDPTLETLRARMTNVAGWLVEPDDKIVQFGDTYETDAPSEFASAAANDDGLMTLRRSGFSFVKRPGAYLGTIGSFHNTTHRHADELSFDLFDRGHRIVSDTGRHDSDRGNWEGFTKSSRAHSVLTVDHESFGMGSKRAYGSAIMASGSGDSSSGEDWYAVMGRNPLLAKRVNVDHRRLLVFKPGVALFVLDRLRSRTRHVYQRFFHFGPEIAVETGKTDLDLSASGFNGSLQIKDLRKQRHRRLVRGRSQPRQGWVSYRPASAEPRWTAAYTNRARDADYVSSLSLQQPFLRAEPIGTFFGNRMKLQLKSSGVDAGTLTVTRSGADLTVVEQP